MWSLVFLHVFIQLRVLVMAFECTPCELRTCPGGKAPRFCEVGRTLARDPCGCCDQCSRLEWELCGGDDWALGYCARGLSCVSVNQTGILVNAPDSSAQVGVCKVLAEYPHAGAEDERCALVSGCERTGGRCVCHSKHSCLPSFTYPSREACIRANRAEMRLHGKRDRPSSPSSSLPPSLSSSSLYSSTPSSCSFSGCNLTEDGCNCLSNSCHAHFTYVNQSQCQEAADALRCVGVSCPPLPLPLPLTPPVCPEDSMLTSSSTPPGGCCPTLPPHCTCRPCPPPPTCPPGEKATPTRQALATPGHCCHDYQCQRVSAQCTHEGVLYEEGEVYRMESCWQCQCRGGVSFCSKMECPTPPPNCHNLYTPEGECCPVCIDIELLSGSSDKASCWLGQSLHLHDDQWKEDDCTFCQCLDGEARCTAMACTQTCHKPVKIPGECCPYCEEPSYETVSPLLCPPLENCTLSGEDCPLGFTHDHNGCLLCQCLGNDSCPDVSSYCSLECVSGFVKDEFGCEVCECSPPTPRCRPLTCSKTCPYGYVRNKHGCEMCRCIKCPAFTCDKQCVHGYQHNKKGCSVCLCREITQASTTLPASPSSSPSPSPAPAPTSSPSPSSPPSSPEMQLCVTSTGVRYEEGSSWHDGCRDCYCHAGGREMCVLITCPAPSCSNPTLSANQCCPSCQGEESGSGQEPEGRGMELVVCRAPGGNLYVEGETWNLDECTRCTCRKGRVLCDSEVCPPVLCQAPTRDRETCCHVCPEDNLKPLLPVNGSQSEYCISTEGDVILAGDSWRANACTSCTCVGGTIQCFHQRCPPADCRVPVLIKGQCCPHCLDTSTSSVPVVLSTTPTSEDWITTATTSTPIDASTDGQGLGVATPTQLETALIYQSAAWILAGLLLAIVIFLLVALLLNKKNKWVQMSCYNAPKKTVILKKHVNKNSLVYMEPSKEHKFQNVRNDATTSPYTLSSMGHTHSHTLGGDRIPRAKLCNGHGKT